MLWPLAIVVAGVDAATQQRLVFELDASVAYGRDTAGPAWGLRAPGIILVPCRRISRRHGVTLGRLKAREFGAFSADNKSADDGESSWEDGEKSRPLVLFIDDAVGPVDDRDTRHYPVLGKPERWRAGGEF